MSPGVVATTATSTTLVVAVLIVIVVVPVIASPISVARSSASFGARPEASAHEGELRRGRLGAVARGQLKVGINQPQLAGVLDEDWYVDGWKGRQAACTTMEDV